MSQRHVLLLSGAGFHQLSVIPEPSTLLLLYAGAFTAWGARLYRRRTQYKCRENRYR